MSYANLHELTAALTRAFARYRPSTNEDVTDKGESVAHFVIPHPTEQRYSVAVEAQEARGGSITCALWFGSVEISGYLKPDDAIAAITEILEDRIVTVAHYKNKDTYDDRHPSGWQKIFQMTDDKDSDEGVLNALLARLNTPPTFIDRLPFTNRTGVFEVARWSGIMVVER